ncbi:MAG: J domain-containing protein [Haloferacaceae archaeon]
MDRDRLLLGLAAVFAGLSVMLGAVGLAEQPFVLLLALPFGATAYFMWHQATGRLERRARARAQVGDPGPEGERRRAAARGPRGGPWTEAGSGAGPGAGDGPGTTGRAPPTPDPGPSPAEAYRILGLEPGADPEDVRAAYRERAKELHPDAESGDEEAFKRITRAYETLTD